MFRKNSLKFLVLFFLLAGGFSPVFAQSGSIAAPEKMPPLLNRSLFIGLKGDDVRLLQEFLAQDKEIYPEGLITGYFGKLTEAAVKRWQKNNGIESVGIVGPKTRAKFKEIREAPPAAETPTILPETAAPATPTVPAPSTPAVSIKTGAGIVANNRYIDIGTGITLLYSGAYAYQHRGYLIPGASAGLIAGIKPSDYSPCENIAIRGYSGISNICQFTDAANYAFSEHKEAIRVYDKKASYYAQSCYQGILLFKHGNIYGGIDPEEIDGEGNLHYRYWYDESGGSNFASLCASSNSNAASNLASVLDSLTSVLQKLNEALK